MNIFSSIKNKKKAFVVFHGTGGNEFSLLFLTGELDPESSVFGFEGNIGSGINRRFFNPLHNNKLDYEAFNLEVDNFLIEWDHLQLSYEEITFIGYSNGANFIQGILSKRPNIAQKTILLHPHEFNLKFSMLEKSNNKLLITTGTTDPLEIPGTILKLVDRLKESFYDVDFILTDSGHEVNNDEIHKIKHWFEQYQ